MTIADRFYDNTRISESRRCLRKYYFRHERHLTTEGLLPLPLAFGSAWHAAMDVLWPLLSGKSAQNLGNSDLATAAYEEGFLPDWQANGHPHPDDIGPEEFDLMAPRHPIIALEMLHAYIPERRKLLSSDGFELLEVERPFAVPLDPEQDDLFYVGRLDKVFALRGKIYVGEHKTTSAYARSGNFRSLFLESFSPNSQIDGYLYAAHSIWGDDVKAVWVDAALVHKSVHDGFAWIPVERQERQLDAWLWETHNQVATIEANKKRLVETDMTEDPYMSAFAKNTNSCWDFAKTCSYINLCKMWANPCCQPLPAGFKESPWSPFDELELGKIGLAMKDD